MPGEDPMFHQQLQVGVVRIQFFLLYPLTCRANSAAFDSRPQTDQGFFQKHLKPPEYTASGNLPGPDSCSRSVSARRWSSKLNVMRIARAPITATAIEPPQPSIARSEQSATPTLARMKARPPSSWLPGSQAAEKPAVGGFKAAYPSPQN